MGGARHAGARRECVVYCADGGCRGVGRGVLCRRDGGRGRGWREKDGQSKCRDLFVVDDAGHVCVLPCHGEYDAGVFERGEFLAGGVREFRVCVFLRGVWRGAGEAGGGRGWEVWVVFGLMPRRWFLVSFAVYLTLVPVLDFGNLYCGLARDSMYVQQISLSFLSFWK